MTNIVKLVVVKSNGSEERFSIDKLRTSLDRAVRHVIKGGDSDIVNEVLDEVVLDISKSVQGGKIKTAEIAERVEKVLISKVIENLVYERIARAYVLARIYNHVYGKGGWSSFDPVDEDLTYAALRVLQARYLLKDSHSGRIKETPKMMFWRVASGIARAEKGDNFEVWRRRFFDVMSKRRFIPNSPTLMNTGTKLGILSACFVIPVRDAMVTLDGDGIYDAVRAQAVVFQQGGGTGFDFSELRPKGDVVASTAGVASGPLSFMRIFDLNTDVIKQGGRRRGANMGVLHIWHPDVLEFIKSKSGALKDTQLQNFNISVGMYDYFFEAITSNEKIPLVNPRKTSIDGSHDSRKYAMVKARHYMKEDWVQEIIIDELEANGGSIPLDKTLLVTIDEALAIAEREGAIMSLEDPVEVFNDIVKSAWESGDPGLIFIDTINRRHPVWYLGKISATNPCVSRDARILTPKGWVKAGDIYEEARRKASPTLVVTSPKLGVGGEPIAYQAELLVPIADVPIGINGHELWFKIAKPVKSYVWYVGRKRALKVITKEGYTIVVTEDHRFLTPNGWKKAKDLKCGDRVALLRLHPASLLSINGEVVDPDIAFTIGWLIGDGVMNEYHVSWHFNPANDKAISRVEAAIAKLGGGEEVHKTNEGSRITIRCNSTSLVYRRLHEYIGKDAHELNGRIPDSVWRWCPEGYAEFLRALFTARGFVDHEGSIVLTALSRELLEDVLVMLSTFGIAGEIGKRDLNEVGSSGPSYLLFSQHELVIRESISRKLFMDYIGFEVGNGFKDDAKHSEDIGPMYYAEVKGVEDVGLKDFYDFTVPGFHNYIAQAIINHNCGEEPLLEWESCNLGSINLEMYVRRSKEDEPYIDWEGLAKDIAVAVRFLDNVITVSRYPLKQLEAAARKARKIGLGVMGWAHMLVKLGIPYDSIDALYLGYYLAEWIAYNAYLASVELSRERGPFPAWDKKLYRPYWITAKPLKELLRTAGVKGEVSEKVRRLIEKRPLVDWSKVREGMLRHGLRNAALLSVAPTGTISIIAGTSSSIEPIFALAFTRVVSVGVFIEVNSLFLEALASYGLDDPEVIKAIAETGSIAHNPFMPRPLRKVFRVAHDIEPIWHVLHQAVWQQWVDAGVSKTVNMRAEAIPDHVRDVYVIAWALGCKGITVYRDKSKSQQVIHFGIKLSKKMAKRGEVLGVETIRSSKVGSDYSGKSTGEPSLIGTEAPLNVGVKTKERGEISKDKRGSRFRLSTIVLEDGDVGDCKSCEY